MSDNVRAVIENGKGQFLILTESDDPDYWKLPGGKIDEGEPIELAIERELDEELGLSASKYSIVMSSRLKTDDGRWNRHIFRVKLNNDVALSPTGEVEKVEWVKSGKVPKCKNQNHIQDAINSVLKK